MRQRDQGAGKAAVEALGALRRHGGVGVEKQPPVHGLVLRDRAEAHQVREEGDRAEALVDLVGVADLAVPVAVGRVGELERDEPPVLCEEVARTLLEQLGGELGADQRRQELVEQHPLVVPDGRAPRLLEDVDHAVRAQPVHEPVVQAQEGHLHLAHEQVDVVARIAEERDALRVAGHVPAVHQELARVVAVVEVRAAGRPAAVHGLEVRARGAEVEHPLRVGVVRERRAVGGDVVGDVLAEERPAGSDRGVVGGAVRAVADPARTAQRMQERLVALQRRQVGEQAPVAAALDRGVDAVGGEAVVAGGDRPGGDRGREGGVAHVLGGYRPLGPGKRRALGSIT
jgi:hypothetical protein